MLQFLYVLSSKRSYDSSTDQGEIANVERHSAAGHLQNAVGLGDKRWGGTTNVSFCSFRLMLGEERERPHVS